MPKNVQVIDLVCQRVKKERLQSLNVIKALESEDIEFYSSGMSMANPKGGF